MPTGIKTTSCKLVTAPHQEQHIEVTMQAFADACNYIVDVGREHEESAKYKLQTLCYHDVRKQFGLSANLTIRALGRVAPRLLPRVSSQKKPGTALLNRPRLTKTSD